MTVRDLASNPVANSSVVVDFSSCAVSFCATQPPGVVIDPVHKTARVLTNIVGQAHFCICVQAPVSGCTAKIYADGVLLCSNLAIRTCPSSTACVPGTWQLVASSGPSARSSFSLASDTNHGTVLLFGGVGAGAAVLGDTWLWDGVQWNVRTPVHQPIARQGASMAYDYFRDRIVLFGGMDAGGNLLDDTWEWNGTDWTQISTVGPDARAGHSIAYDFRRQRIVLFGGETSGGAIGDTWEYSGSWTQVATGGPSARRGAALAYDLGRERIVLFGGDDGNPENDTWVWDGVDWEHLAVYGAGWPSVRSGHAMAYGNECNSVVMFGGSSSDSHTRAWNGAVWVDVPAGPGARQSHGMAYDLAQGRVLLFGGADLASGDLLADTWEWCSPCSTPLAPTDSLGNPLLPAALDPTTPGDVETVDHSTGYVSDQYPEFTLDNSWYSQIPCDWSLGGDDDPADEEPELDSSLDSLGIDISVEAALDSLDAYEEANFKFATSQAPILPTAGAVGLPYVFPATPHCTNPSNPFGGRDIIFIHGLRTTPIIQKLLGTEPKALVEWQMPTHFPGDAENPEFYGDGYWKQGAERYWQNHIKRFLTDKGYTNRYLVVAWPATQRLEVGVHAMLTQIADAMQYGTGVVDPSGNHDCSNFGTPDYVIVSHSTGGLITPVALRMAQDLPNLQADYISRLAKAQVAFNIAAAGSQLASTAVAVGRKALNAANILTSECQMVNQTLFVPTGNSIDCDLGFPDFAAIGSSVLVDLCPSVARGHWGPVMNSPKTIHTVTLGGGHPTTDGTDPPAKWSKFSSFVVKRLILTGLDDGVNPLGSQAANAVGWPPGYSYSGSRRMVKDLGLKLVDEKRRMKGYFRDQWKDVGDRAHDETSHKLVTIGANEWVAPWGVLQNPHSPAPGHEPGARLTNHFSFMESASHHYGTTPGSDTYFNQNDYENTPPSKEPFPHPQDEINDEETVAITDNAVFARYGKGASTLDPRDPYYTDSAPLLASVPRVVGWIRGRQIPGFKITVFGHTFQKGPWWLWYRQYHWAEGYENNVLADYAYQYVLPEPPPPCTPGCCARPPMGLVAWWPGEAGYDPAVPDVTPDVVSPRAQGVRLQGASISPTGRVGSSFQFDGTNDYVQAPDKLKLRLGSSFTIQAWVYTRDELGMGKVIVDKGTWTSQPSYGLRLYQGRPGLVLRNASCTSVLQASSIPSLVDSCWHLIHVTKQGSTVRFYVDGAVAAVFTGVCNGSTMNTLPLRIGGLPGDPASCFSGQIDEVAMWKRALSPSEVSALWVAGQEGMCRESWWLPSTVLAKSGQAVVHPVICNFTTSSFNALYRFVAQPAGGACTVAGPTSFSPTLGSASVVAGKCTVLPAVTLTLPLGMQVGDRSCYQMQAWFRVSELPACYQIAVGRVVKGLSIWDIGSLTNSLSMVPSDLLAANVQATFDLANLSAPGGPSGNLAYEITVVPTLGDTAAMASFRLNGLPPGVALTGSVNVAAAGTAHVIVNVAATDLLGDRAYDLVFAYDTNGDGIPDPVAVIGLGDFADQTPVTVDPGQDAHWETLRWARAVPNPFTVGTGIEFELAKPGWVEIAVYDIAGRRLVNLSRSFSAAGPQRVSWDGRDEQGRAAESGVYMVRMRSSDRAANAKMLLVRERR